jgi:hypothetical protein
LCHAKIFCETRRERANNKARRPEQTPVKTQQPIASEEEHRVLKFRPRTLTHPPGRPGNSDDEAHDDARQESDDLSRYERDRNEPDDFRHRMLANVAALAFTVALTAIGIWLAISIADLRKTQDCVLMGRRDCARISTTHF